MKRIILMLVIIIVVFIVGLYWSVSSTSKRFSVGELINVDNVNTINFKDYDSVYISASSLYDSNMLKDVMQGEQYRKAWSTPINVQIVFLDTLFGGMTILKEGGGKQTHSLKLKSKKGIVYTLRSINKDPKVLIPEIAKTLGLENIIVDGISAQHPYAALLAAYLADAADVLYTHPKLVFVPKQDILGSYNDKYGNRLFLLEFETEGGVNWTSLNHVVNIIDTEDLQELKLLHGDKVKIDKNALVRARLFDFVIGDWDRHTKQWGWVIQKNKEKFTAIPIAGDRDNAFFDAEGIIPSLISNKYVVPEMNSYEKEINFLEGMVYPFDRYFLLNTAEDIFTNEAKSLQNKLTDHVIHEALKTWPKSISDLDGEEIISKLKSRRDNLIYYAKQFKYSIDKKGVVNEPLKDSEDLKLETKLLYCFDCE